MNIFHFKMFSYHFVSEQMHNFFSSFFFKREGGLGKPKYSFYPPYRLQESNPNFGQGYTCTATNPTAPLRTNKCII